MTIPRVVPDDVQRLQTAASDPAISAWVAANAGSGKTYVLAQRVIRLLLDGVDPARILCITFTKAAAANMSHQVFGTLAKWTSLDDEALDKALRGIANATPDAALRALARRLFAQALETPGGLKVQTIHAFCTRLLHQFPFEANVAARFEVLDEAAQTQLLEQLSLGLLLDAARTPDSTLGRALATAIAAAADQTFKDVVGEAIRKRDAVRAWIDHGGSVEAAVAGLCNALGVAAGDTIEAIDAETTEGPLLPASEWPAVAAVLDQGSKSDKEQAARLRTAARQTGEERAETYRRCFLTGTGEPRKQLVTRAIEAGDPELAARLQAERSRVVALIERRKAVACRDRTGALLAIADALISRYQAEKDRRGLLDYDDLIDKAFALLGEDRAAWVHYKLDRGIDHVLIDEAQDTSQRQWDIIRLLVGEFFAGAGARPLNRTVFAVGDEKQSIFSFQGAAPRRFDEMRRAFTTMCQAIEQEFRYIRFGYSFRSGDNVLGAVDKVFAEKSIYVSITSDEAGVTPHLALPDAAPGLVEIWETTKPDEKRELEAWDAPFDDLTETSPQARLARRVALNVKRWTRQGARAGEVLVLVRQRGPLFDAIIRALKDAEIAVAGADRLVLAEHIAVMDLSVLADALLLPDDDLALATVLKSPLFGFDDDDLFKIAWRRKSSLRAALKADPRFTTTAATLDRYAEWARRDTPFAFYARVLGPERGRQRFLARLGLEAIDALDEFLNLALDYERRETPSLQGFIAWLRTTRTDVKRDMEIARDEVRVMTVHGAKGLEAPIVVLADTMAPPAGPPQRQPKLLSLPAERAPPGTPDALVWAAAKATDVALVGEARLRAQREAEHEYRRLLYVAMTRARERLIVCGAEGERGRPEGCWYDLVRNALQPISEEEPADDGDGSVWRYRKTAATGGKSTAAAAVAEPVTELPKWLAHAAPVEPPALVPMSPSADYDEAVPVRATASRRAERLKALERGRIVHRLLQSLPDIARDARAEAARRHIARTARILSAQECEEVAEQVGRILDDTRFAALFSPGSRAEVPLVGRIARLAVSGQVDRLVVTDAAVLIADYKTNQPAPRRLEDVPQPYLRQLALYRAVLAQLYPSRPIRAALIWTDVPDLMEVSAESMEQALAALTSA